jgi:hypothetical protein
MGFWYGLGMRANLFLTGALGLVLGGSMARGAAPVWALNFNTQINQVFPAVNLDMPVIPGSPVQSDGLAADPAGKLYVADSFGTIFQSQNPLPLWLPVGNVGFNSIADLSYSSGGLWGFDNSSDTLFFFNLGSNALTYSLPITSGLGSFNITGVTQQQSTGDIFLSGNVGLNSDVLFLLDLNTASASTVGAMPHGDQFSYISDIEFTASGQLLAMTWYHRDFYAVNPANAGMTLISNGPHRDVTGLAVDTSLFPAQAGGEVPEVGTWLGGVLLAAAGLGRGLGRFYRRQQR